MLDVNIKSSSDSNVKVVKLTGEFDLFDQERVESLIYEVVTDDLRGMIFDLTAVTYMEEAGYETLVRYLQQFLETGACMAVIVTPGSRTMKRLENMGFFDLGLKLFNSTKEAERAMQDDGCK